MIEEFLEKANLEELEKTTQKIKEKLKRYREEKETELDTKAKNELFKNSLVNSETLEKTFLTLPFEYQWKKVKRSGSIACDVEECLFENSPETTAKNYRYQRRFDDGVVVCEECIGILKEEKLPEELHVQYNNYVKFLSTRTKIFL